MKSDLDQSGAGSPNDAIQLLAMANIAIGRCVHAVAVLGVADLLEEGPLPVEELATAAGAHAPSLQRILRALASVGVFVEVDPGRFGLTPMAELLRTNHPHSPREAFIDHPLRWAAWGAIAHSARTGQPAFEKVHGVGYFDWLSDDPDGSAWFNRTMESARLLGRAVAGTYDFSPYASVVDVGGGTGSVLADILQSSPNTTGVLLELSAVAEQASLAVARAGLEDRCRVVAGDFFEAVPAGGDVYVLARVLHDWDDELAARILTSVRQAAPEHARLLVVEIVLPEGNEPHPGRWLDINMLVMTGGRERTAAEFAALFADAGFHLSQVLATPGPVSLLEATRA